MPEEKVSSVKIPKNAGELANNWDKHEKVSDPQRGQWVQRCVTWSFPHQCCIQPLPPAADAGPRQPLPDKCPKCGVSFAGSPRNDTLCVFLDGEYMCEGCKYRWRPAAPPVPQAAPRECDCEECASRLATAPDGAMRVAREFVESRLIAPFLHGDEKHQEWLREETRKWIPDLAALIRQAGSRERKHPPSNELLSKISRELPEQLQPMYCSMSPVPLEQIRSLIIAALQDVADDQYAQAYEFVSRAGEAGSERERQLETLVRKMAGCTVCKNCTAEASRLLGGE